MIESLLKQLRNPHLSQPTPIANYRAGSAAASADPQSANVRAWLDRVTLGPSPQPHPGTKYLNGGGGGGRQQQLLAPPEGPLSPASDEGRTDGSADGISGESSVDSTGGLVRGPDALIPDPQFPVGLFANLSLGSAKRSARARAQQGEGGDEDDVVRDVSLFLSLGGC